MTEDNKTTETEDTAGAAGPEAAPEAAAEAVVDAAGPQDTGSSPEEPSVEALVNGVKEAMAEAGQDADEAVAAAGAATDEVVDAVEAAVERGAEPVIEPESVSSEVVSTVSHAPEPTPAEPVVSEPAAPTPEPVTAAALAGAALAATASVGGGSGRTPVWSDQGDAPFDDGELTRPERKDKKPKGGGNEFLEIIKTVAIALLIAVVVRIFLFQPFTIPSASMEPNLYKGDYIVVTKWSYGYSKHAIPYSPPLFEGRILNSAPQRGDIAVFKLPSNNKTDYIKRVIGVPGDRVQMINNVLHINGEPVQNVVVSSDEMGAMFAGQTVTRLRETLPGGRSYEIQDFGPGNALDNTPVFEVPQGYYFMMGDNRDNSIDSRDQSASGVGLVPEQNLIGKAEIILFSWEGASLYNPISWFTTARTDRFFKRLK